MLVVSTVANLELLWAALLADDWVSHWVDVLAVMRAVHSVVLTAGHLVAASAAKSVDLLAIQMVELRVVSKASMRAAPKVVQTGRN